MTLPSGSDGEIKAESNDLDVKRPELIIVAGGKEITRPFDWWPNTTTGLPRQNGKPLSPLVLKLMEPGCGHIPREETIARENSCEDPNDSAELSRAPVNLETAAQPYLSRNKKLRIEHLSPTISYWLFVTCHLITDIALFVTRIRCPTDCQS